MRGSFRNVPWVLAGVASVIGFFVVRPALHEEPEISPLAAPIEELHQAPEETYVPVLPEVPILGDRAKLHRPVPLAEDTLQQEVRLLDEARRVLHEEPQRALDLANQHRTRFTDGALKEQREAYACIALATLGRTDELERRYTDFVLSFPTSSLMPEVSRALEHPAREERAE